MIPSSKPQVKRDAIAAKVFAEFRQRHPGEPIPPVIVGAVRGYYRDTMGKPGVNDRGIYDDAFMVITPDVFATFNGNVDPSRHRQFVASLEAPQVVWYAPGKHPAKAGPTQHDAFRQASSVIVRRDGHDQPKGKVDPQWGISLGGGRWTDHNWGGGKFWTNLHRGGRGTTSSLGCLTVPPGQFEAMRGLIAAELKRHGQKRFPVVLIET